MKVGENSVCNLCGHLCSLADHNGQVLDHAAGLIDAHVSGGYHSTAGNGFGALDDITSYRFNLCEFCLDWLFTQFVVPVETSCYLSGEAEPFRPAEERVRNDEWRKMKEEFFTELEKRTLCRKDR